MKLRIAAIVPSLNPNANTIKFINDLIEVGFDKIIVINDGSDNKYDKYFDEIQNKEECFIVKHNINQGKGRSIKTGMNYFLNNFSDYDGVVTADSDGQHTALDTFNIAQNIYEHQDSLILGTRNFDYSRVPFKSKFGNKCTTFIMKMLYGKKINDTQTGLRGIPTLLIPDFLSISGERYDYEINVLIAAIREKIKIVEVEIETIYEENNIGSHFNPITDSLKIYKIIFGTFFYFTVAGMASFFVDIFLFSMFANHIFSFLEASACILVSTIIARIISSLFNYNLNKKIFKRKQNKKNSIIRYYALCVTQMLASALLTICIYNFLPFTKVFSKIMIDIVLFVISYQIQNRWVFVCTVDKRLNNI